MKHFDQLLSEDIAQYEGRHDDLIYQAPALYRLLVKVLDDNRLPVNLRRLVIAGIAYFILPVDVIPEEIEGPYGYVDDIYLAAWIARKIAIEAGEAIVIENWDGECPVMPLVEDILSREAELVGEKGPEIFTYLGIEK